MGVAGLGFRTFGGIVLDKRRLRSLASQLATAIGIGGPILMSWSVPAPTAVVLEDGSTLCDIRTDSPEFAIVKAGLHVVFGNSTCHNMTINTILDTELTAR